MQYQEITAGEDATMAIPADPPPFCDPLFLIGPHPGAAYGAEYADGCWRLTVPGALTAALPPGIANWELWNRSPMGTIGLVGKGRLRVLPSLAAGHDFRSYNRQILDALKAALLRLAAEDEVEISIHNRTIKLADPEKVQKMIDIYQAKVSQEASGGGAIACIPVALGRRW